MLQREAPPVTGGEGLRCGVSEAPAVQSADAGESTVRRRLAGRGSEIWSPPRCAAPAPSLALAQVNLEHVCEPLDCSVHVWLSAQQLEE